MGCAIQLGGYRRGGRSQSFGVSIVIMIVIVFAVMVCGGVTALMITRIPVFVVRTIVVGSVVRTAIDVVIGIAIKLGRRMFDAGRIRFRRIREVRPMRRFADHVSVIMTARCDRLRGIVAGLTADFLDVFVFLDVDDMRIFPGRAGERRIVVDGVVVMRAVVRAMMGIRR